ncbi:hypothetical protein GPECTOR_45g124 [Gonium pectorale]|uniref:HAUS augmin-like complex subunit 6 N-terminal domain-containing protein n=1 Tax=Gonium pectorale TaxID=33097 RepID=A0A150G8U2_GONPE|nr:hypothetical protein GPECTOR_45g124 [Gonium pectorale]|eukprot:KXZ46254.1 hypothetical protein GPECTOR_45g124 [Gonium pectorale]
MRSSAAASGKQEVPTLEEQHLYTNLCILGIVNPGLAGQGIELGRTCFRRSNNKALEHVLIRLFTIIEGKARAQKEFKGMLPVLDKVQQAPFYQKIGEWMNELKKSGRLEPSVILPVSALKTNTSQRLVLLLLELSTLALHHDLEATCPGACRQAYIPNPGPTATDGGVSGFNGLLDDSSHLPGEVRYRLSASRAKEAAGEFLETAATCSRNLEVMEKLSQDFTQKYYALKADMGRQPASQGGASATAGGLDAGMLTPRRGNPNSTTGGPGDLDAPFGTATAPASPLPRKELNAETVARVSALVAGVSEHLQTHAELAKALMTDDMAGQGTGASSGSSSGGGPAGQVSGAAGAAEAFPGGQHAVQRLHPHEIDGAVLMADAAAAVAAATAAAAATDDDCRSTAQDACQRRMHKGFLTPFVASDLVGAFLKFSSVLRSLAPHLHAVAGGDAESERQKLRALNGRLESSRFGYDYVDDEPMPGPRRSPQWPLGPLSSAASGEMDAEMAWAAPDPPAWQPPPSAMPAQPFSARSTASAGGGGAAAAGTPFSCDSASASASAVTAAAAAPADTGTSSQTDALAILQARMRNLKTSSTQPSVSTASAQGPSASGAAPSTATSAATATAPAPGSNAAASGGGPMFVSAAGTFGSSSMAWQQEQGAQPIGSRSAGPAASPAPQPYGGSQQPSSAPSRRDASPGWPLPPTQGVPMVSPHTRRMLDSYFAQQREAAHRAPAQQEPTFGGAGSMQAASFGRPSPRAAAPPAVNAEPTDVSFLRSGAGGGFSFSAGGDGDADFALLAAEGHRLSLAFGSSSAPSPPRTAHAPSQPTGYPPAGFPPPAVLPGQGRRGASSAWGSSDGGGGGGFGSSSGGGGAAMLVNGIADRDGGDDVQAAATDVEMVETAPMWQSPKLQSPKLEGMAMAVSPRPAAPSPVSSTGTSLSLMERADCGGHGSSWRGAGRRML